MWNAKLIAVVFGINSTRNAANSTPLHPIQLFLYYLILNTTANDPIKYLINISTKIHKYFCS